MTCVGRYSSSSPTSRIGTSLRTATYLDVSRTLVKAAYGEEPPLVADPFAGGGSIPLEALRLGCEAFSSDLNPVACLILKVEVVQRVLELGEEKQALILMIEEALFVKQVLELREFRLGTGSLDRLGLGS